jgi:predicted metal-dependent enzyme (double-stranded beta helix superfamily)
MTGRFAIADNEPQPLREVTTLRAIEEFVAQCSAAVKQDRGQSATKEVVERAVRDRALLEGLPLEAGVKVLHGAEDLTILHVVMAARPVGAGSPIPHNHLMWALIGVTHGREENEFFRRSGPTIEPSRSGRVIGEGEVLTMDDDTIHSVRNPSSERLTSALHVYGGNLIAAEKTMWCEPEWAEEPFDFFRVITS